MKITIPTEREFQDRLVGLEQLLTATRWERAAIVYAFTEPSTGGGDQYHRPENQPVSFPCSMSEFARLGIKGLAHKDTVAEYRRIYSFAVKSGAQPIAVPGKTVDLNTEMDWPPTGHTSGSVTKQSPASQVKAAREILSNPEMVDEILDEPETAQVIAKAVHRQADRRFAETQQRVAAKKAEMDSPEYQAKAADARQRQSDDPEFQTVVQAEAFFGLTHQINRARADLDAAVQHAADLDAKALPDNRRAALLERLNGIDNRLRWIRSTVEGQTASLDNEIADLLSGH